MANTPNDLNALITVREPDATSPIAFSKTRQLDDDLKEFLQKIAAKVIIKENESTKNTEQSLTVVKRWGGNGSARGEFLFPSGMAFNSKGELYIADNGNGRVQKFDTNGNYIGQFGKLKELKPATDYPGLVGDWSFQFGEAVFSDQSKNKVNGTILNITSTVPLFESTDIGYAMPFTTTGEEQIKIQPPAELSNLYRIENEWTFSIWVSMAPETQPRSILTRTITGATQIPFSLTWDGTKFSLTANYMGKDTKAKVIIATSGTDAIETNKFHHLVASFSMNTMKLYVDGILKGSVFIPDFGSSIKGEGILMFGKCNAKIGAFMLWNRMLSEIEINNMPTFVADGNLKDASDVAIDHLDNIYVADPEGNSISVFDSQHNLFMQIKNPADNGVLLLDSPTIEYAHWDFSHYKDLTITDIAKRRSMAVMGANWISANQVKAFKFDGVRSYAWTTDLFGTGDNAVSLIAKPKLCIHVYLKPAARLDGETFPANAVSTQHDGIFSPGVGVNVWPHGSSLTISFPNGMREITSFKFEAETSYHIVVNYTQAGYVAYVDGVPVDSFIYDQSMTNPSGTKIRLGCFDETAIEWGSRAYFKGVIFDAAIYGRTLSESEVQILSQTGTVRPISVAVDRDQNVFVADIVLNKIFKYSSAGAIKRIWGNEGSDEGHFLLPLALAVDSLGYVYVVDSGNKRIQKFDNDGNFLKSFGNQEGDANLLMPQGICVDGGGRVCVADNNSIKIYGFGGGLLENINQVVNGEQIVNSAFGITIDTSGDIYFSSANQWIYRIRQARGTQLLADFRMRGWSKTLRLLHLESVYAEKNYENMNQHYQNIYEASIRAGMDIETMEASRAALKDSLKEKIKTENAYQEFINFLSSNRIDTLGSFENINDYLTLAIRKNQWEYSLFIKAIQNSTKPTEIRQYSFVNGDYIDQYGVSLHYHIQNLSENGDPNKEYVVIIPVDKTGQEGTGDRVLIIRNPQFSGAFVHPANCLFLEQYQIDLSWLGITLGEFSHSINLMPGEQRQVEITTSKKKTWEVKNKSTTSSSSNSDSEATTDSSRTDDFETKLHNELQSNRKFSNSNDYSSNSRSETTIKANVGFKVGPFGAKVDVSNTNTSDFNYSSSANSSAGTVNKNVNDMMQSASSETSENNKVAFKNSSQSTSSVEETQTGEDMESSKETLTLKNINMGRSINYNFFQVQNIYGSVLKGKDVVFYLNTGIEIIKGTGITITRKFNLNNYKEIKNSFTIFSKEDKDTLTQLIALQIIRRYLFVEGEDNNADQQLCIMKGVSSSEKALKITPYEQKVLRNKCKKMTGTAILLDQKIKSEIDEFTNLELFADPLVIGATNQFTINSGKYYVDSQLGEIDAIEDYLKTRRDIETDKQKAVVEDLKARTDAGIFFPEIPDSVTKLELRKLMQKKIKA